MPILSLPVQRPAFDSLLPPSRIVDGRSSRNLPFQALSRRVRINIIPFDLRFLCFHTVTHSFASSKVVSLVFSISCALFQQNTRGGGTNC